VALNDKLEQNKSMEELLKETRELNELMRSYIRVQMNEDGATSLSVDHHLEKIRAVSVKVHQQMESTLQKQGNMLNENDKHLRSLLSNAEDVIGKNNHRTLDKLDELDQNSQSRLDTINNKIRTSTNEMQKELNKVVKDAQQDSRDLVSKAKKGAMASYWGDAVKYGLATSGITVPLLLIGQWIFF
jgi:ElaB/YqjD/DUF883 family membrane-anchored ribosome-binding protein